MSLVSSLHALRERPRRGLRAHWRWLLAQVRYRRERVSLRVLQDATSDQIPDCDTCHDHCCKHPHVVPLRLEDIARLKDAGLDTAIVPAEGPKANALYREPTLRRDSRGVCVFLDEHQRCTIYELRPIVCRRFPYYVADDVHALRYAESCRSRVVGRSDELRAAAVDSYNQRLSDYLLVQNARSALVRLGLLEDARNSGEAFRATLTKKS